MVYNLNIMTFNVRNLHGDDGTVNSWDNRKSRAVNAINSFGPDIIGMQEAYKVQIDYFLNNLTHYRSIGDSRKGDTTDEYANIMYRSDKFNVLESGQFWISETPDVPDSRSSFDSGYPRIVTWAKFQAECEGRAVFYYFNTHLSLKTDAKVQGVNLILDRVSRYVTHSECPVFIGGDLNSDELSPAYRILSNSDFQDTWVQLRKPFIDDSTGNHWTAQKDIDHEHIDWIFQRNAARVNSLEINYYTEDGLNPSDHYPVQLNVDIPLTGDGAEGGSKGL